MIRVPTLFALGFSLLAEPQAPPPAYGPIPPTSAPAQSSTHPARHGQGTTLYSIGEPSDEEQLYVELVNRVRLDPVGEALGLANTTDPRIRSAYQFFGVDLQKFVDDVAASYTVAAPLAINAQLTAAARGHSQWMLVNQMQAHNQTNGLGQVTSTPGDRIVAAGYGSAGTFGYAESVFASAESVEHGHAGFEVDWGVGPGGMQNPPGHRNSNHNPLYREIGVGVGFGSNSQYTNRPSVGPQQVTMEFAYKSGGVPLVTGVAYYDLNSNQRYDLGEGLRGITVNVTGSAFHAVTTGSGGYAVPSADGVRTVTFSGLGLGATNASVTVSGGQNVKADLRLAYQAPSPVGAATPAVGFPNRYTFPGVPGATGYTWQSATLSPWVVGGVEGAEQGLASVTVVISGGYSPVSASIKRSGLAGFQLAHPTPVDQLLTLNQRLRPRTGATLTFWKRIGFATTNQIAQVEVSENNGTTWTPVWAQAGNGATSSANIEKTFTQQTVSLVTFAGRPIRVRFAYLFKGGSYFPGADDPKGFYFDDIAFSATDILGNVTTNAIAADPAFDFTPQVAGDYLLSVQPQVSGRLLPAGASLAVSATVQAVLQVGKVSIVPEAGGKIRLTVPVAGGVPVSVQLERSASPSGPFELTGHLATVSGGNTYTFNGVEATASGGYFRVRAQ